MAWNFRDNGTRHVCIFRHGAFIAGSMLAVFVILTVVDEDFLNVEHVIAAMTVLGIIVTLCRSIIPDEVTTFFFILFVAFISRCFSFGTILVSLNKYCSQLCLLPDECCILQHMVICPELLMRAVLAQVHYMPDTWKGNAHTYRVRDEFSMLFQYKAVSLRVPAFKAKITKRSWFDCLANSFHP